MHASQVLSKFSASPFAPMQALRRQGQLLSESKKTVWRE
jgi:hypothetical protein